MIAALYLRSATKDDGAIAEQRRICAEHAAARGWSLGEVFVDHGANGASDDRPGLADLRQHLLGRHAAVVIAEDGFRLFRDVVKLGDFYGFCDALGVEVSCARSSVSSFDLLNRLSEEEIAERPERAVLQTTE